MAQAASRAGEQCPRGHHLDPNWPTCPYCAAEERAGERSPAPNLSIAGERRTTVGAASPPRADQRDTRVMPPAVSPQGAGYVGEGDSRRIVGVLISYTWHPEGDLYPVREGKTFIGSGDVSSEAYHRPCDVQIHNDQRMSSEHALILCRHGAYEIIDQSSSNGTFLNGKLLKANDSTDIPNYGEIQTGSTVWAFLQIQPPRDADVAPPAPGEPPPPVEPPPQPPSSGSATRVQ